MRAIHRFCAGFAADIRGASAIEFAVVASLFFTLIFAVVVYGSYFISLSLVNNVAYEAARATVAGLSDSERSALAQARAAEVVAQYGNFLKAEDIQVDAGPSGEGTYAVTVHHQFTVWGGQSVSNFVPLPPTNQTATVEVSHGGY